MTDTANIALPQALARAAGRHWCKRGATAGKISFSIECLKCVAGTATLAVRLGLVPWVPLSRSFRNSKRSFSTAPTRSGARLSAVEES